MRLYYSKFNWNACINKERRHPFKQFSFTVSTSTPDNEMIDMFIPENLILRKDVPYFVHIDQSVTGDATGTSLSHLHLKDKDIEKVVIDFMLQITAPGDLSSEIDIGKVRDFYLHLRQVYKIKIGFFSYDQYASRESLQVLKKKNIECGLQSVDRDDTQYRNFNTLLNKHMVDMYEYPIIEREYFNLVHDLNRRKVDHEDGDCKIFSCCSLFLKSLHI